MLPIDFFKSLIKDLSLKPFRFLSLKQQDHYRRHLYYFTVYFRAYLYLKKLRKSDLGNILDALVLFLAQKEVDEKTEVTLIGAINSFLNFYEKVENEKLNQEIKELNMSVNKIYKIAREHFHFLEQLDKESSLLVKTERNKHDLDLLNGQALFYLLEYHLEMYFQLTHAKDNKKITNLIEAGETKLPKGTLMGLRYEFYSREFLTVLVYKIYSHDLREKLLKIFYDFNEQLVNKDHQIIISGYRNFVHEFSQFLAKAGVKKVSSIIYSPYGQEPTIDQLLKEI